MILKIKVLVKVRDIHKIQKKNSIGISVFGYENQDKHPIYVSKKCCEEKHVEEKEEKGKRHYVLIKNFSTFMYNHTFYRYCLQAFGIEEILKNYTKDCFKINDKQKIIMPKKR